MTRRKIYFQGMKWVDDAQSKIDPNQRFDVQSKNENQTPKKESLTKDRKIKLDKMIKGNGFKEV